MIMNVIPSYLVTFEITRPRIYRDYVTVYVISCIEWKINKRIPFPNDESRKYSGQRYLHPIAYYVLLDISECKFAYETIQSLSLSLFNLVGVLKVTSIYNKDFR